MKRLIHLALGLGIALSLVGCGGSSGGSTDDAASSSTDPTTQATPTDGASMSSGQAPSAVCAFKSDWNALDARLTAAEADLHDAGSWAAAASAFDAATAPEAVKDAWGPLVNDVDAIAQAVQTGDDAQIQSAETSRLPEEKRLHQNFAGLFGQLCP